MFTVAGILQLAAEKKVLIAKMRRGIRQQMNPLFLRQCIPRPATPRVSSTAVRAPSTLAASDPLPSGALGSGSGWYWVLVRILSGSSLSAPTSSDLLGFRRREGGGVGGAVLVKGWSGVWGVLSVVTVSGSSRSG